MTQEIDSDNHNDGLAGLRTLLTALEQADARPSDVVEVFIRVHGHDDRTLKITLSGIDEVRTILKTSLGIY